MRRDSQPCVRDTVMMLSRCHRSSHRGKIGREEEDIIKQPWKLTKTMARGLYIGFYYYCEFPLSFSPVVQWTAREN